MVSHCRSLAVTAALLLGSLLSFGPAAMADTEVRQIAGFNAIELEGNAHLDVRLGDHSEVVVDASPTLLPHILTEVENRRLVIHQDMSGWFGAWNKVAIHVTLPELDAVQLNGAGSATLTDIHNSAISLLLTGSGQVTATGAIDQLGLDIKGSGGADLGGLEATRADVTVDGSGGARLNVKDSLVAAINGSGNVDYSGQPQIASTVNGSGRLRGLDASAPPVQR